jgi:hypothetical protein
MRSILESRAAGGEPDFDKSQILQETAMIRYNKRLVMFMLEPITESLRRYYASRGKKGVPPIYSIVRGDERTTEDNFSVDFVENDGRRMER